jgi:type 1 glutamine amidotransferase
MHAFMGGYKMFKQSIIVSIFSLALSPAIAARLCPAYVHPSSKCESKLKNVTILHLEPHAGNGTASNGLITTLGAANGFNVTRHDDGSTSDITPTNLAKFDVLVLNGGCEIGLKLSATEKATIENWYAKGKGFFAIHCACWPRSSWPWFGDLFANNLQDTYKAHTSPSTTASMVLDNEGRNHEAAKSSAGIVVPIVTKADEYYVYKGSPRGIAGVEITYVLNAASRSDLSLDMSDVKENPLSWFREYKGGRAYWSYLGHDAATFENKLIADHFLGALKMVAGYDIVGCNDPKFSQYDANVTKSNPAACATVDIMGGNNQTNRGFAVDFNNQNLKVSIHNNGSHRVVIRSTKGEIIVNEKGNGDKEYNFQNQLERGVYFINVETRRPQRQVHSEKFTVY